MVNRYDVLLSEIDDLRTRACQGAYEANPERTKEASRKQLKDWHDILWMADECLKVMASENRYLRSLNNN